MPLSALPSARWRRGPRALIAVLLGLLAAQLAAAPPPADAVVAADGSGDYTSLQAAISAAPLRTDPALPRWVIHVRPGTYRERIYVQRERGHLHIRGDDAATTTVVFNLHANLPGPDGQPIGTFRTPTVQIDGDGMVWENLTIANDAGPVGQALALRADGDRLEFRRCRFLGWQDTLLLNRGRHYFADCLIEGHVDFIFGGATAYFDRCHVHCLRDGYITAASTPKDQPHGFVFADGRITGAEGVRTYLGRPWRDFARTVFLRTEMSAAVLPAGWHNWSKPAAEATSFYAEWANTGPGADATERVTWARKLGTGDTARFSPAAVLAGADGWNPAGGPVLHLAGDSTMADKPDASFPERGWGQLFRALAAPPLRVVNHAANGRSTKSFRDLGHWQRLLDQLAADDWVVLQFGHNDEKQADPARYTDPTTDYPENLRRFVREVRARGAHPVLATPVARRAWDERGALRETHGDYPAAVRAVAAAEGVPLLDLALLTRDLLTDAGPAGSEQLFMNFAPGEHPRLPEGRTDNTHFTVAGAQAVARLAAREMQRLRLPFAIHLRLADSADPAAAPWQPDLGDGRYRNPILHADYSDPDAVRVGDDYWMVASSFSHVPGLPVLHSRDLVNWELVAHALPRLVPESAFSTPQHGKGVWAPALRHHAGKFWLYYPDPDFGLYLLTATDPRGPWSAPTLVQAGRGLIDPCPLWDDDGRLYLIHGWAKSRAGINNVLTLLRLSADGTRVAEDLGVIIDGAQFPGVTTLEGPKLYRRDGWYYVFAPAGGVSTGWQSVFRSRQLRGPYEERRVLAQGGTAINGPHQGAWVDTPAGESWFLHFQDRGPYGRIVHLEPVAWRDGWPLMGTGVATGAATGEPVLTHPKPAVGSAPGVLGAPPTSDEFAGATLGLQWQWQANPAADWLSLTARPGHLRLFSQPEPAPGALYDAPFLLLQKFPAPTFSATAQLEFAPSAHGETAGLIVFGHDYAWIGLRATATGSEFVWRVTRDAPSRAEVHEVVAAAPVPAGPVWLRVTIGAEARCRFASSLDGVAYTPLGDEFPASVGRWVGAKVGLFAASPPLAAAARGHADFSSFHVTP